MKQTDVGTKEVVGIQSVDMESLAHEVQINSSNLKNYTLHLQSFTKLGFDRFVKTWIQDCNLLGVDASVGQSK